MNESAEIMEINPLIYKGYFNDTESGWYYLRSGYYDPTLGRFINADCEIGEIGDTANQNLFVYCGNNPVMFADENGNAMKWWHKVLIGVAVIAVVEVAAAVTVATAEAGSAAACIATSMLVGAIKGAAIGAVSGAVMGGAIGAVSGAIQTGTWEGTLLVKGSAGYIVAALGSLSPVGLVIGVLGSAYVVAHATEIAEALVTASIHRKGIDLNFGWKWDIIPWIVFSART